MRDLHVGVRLPFNGAFDAPVVTLRTRLLPPDHVRTGMSYKIVPVIGLVFVLACSRSAEPSKVDKAALCTATQAQLGAALKGDEATFEASVVRMALACAIACDAGDAPSCTVLDTDGYRYCSTTEHLCKAACKELRSPSLEKAVCVLTKP